MFIEDSTGAIRLSGDAAHQGFVLGDEVEAIGIPSFERMPTLTLKSVRRLWAGSTPLPLAMDADSAAEGNANGYLVQLNAKLIGEERTKQDIRLTLQGGSQIFAATLERSEYPSDLESSAWPLNSEVRLMGVLVLNPEPPVLPDAPFQLMLRSPEDIEVLRPAPWWNLEHSLWVAAGLGFVLLFAYVQWQRVQASRLKDVMEERGRIARDIHDTLAQCFAGITLQLQGAELLFRQDPDAALAAMKGALGMVRRSRTDAHHAIRVLRSMSRDESLESLLELTTADVIQSSVKIIHESRGTPQRLTYQITNQLFHICMEAFANAVQHGAPSVVVFSVCYTPEGVELQVKDDGSGFDVEHAGGVPKGHFGITGMRERAEAIAGQLTIDSSASGTTVRVFVPKRK